jgi:hypothetical protein
LPPTIAGPVVVVVGSVVEGTALVVVASVVVGATVVVGAVVVGAVVVGWTVVVGVVTVGRVVAMNVESAWMVVVPPAVAGVRAGDGGVVATGPLCADGTVTGAVVDGRSEVGGSWVVVDADAGAGPVGEVGSATPGVRRGGGG